MSCDIFVGNLNPDVRTRDLENVFDKHGKVIRIDLKRNFAFVQFDDREDADKAIRKEDGRRLLGSEMTVEWAKSKVDKPYRGGGGDNRSRSPKRFGRDRSPVGRNGYQGNPRFARDSFDRGNSRFENRPSRNRSPPMRDTSPRGNRYMDSPPPRGDRRDRGPRRF